MNTSVRIISLSANSSAYRNADRLGFMNVFEELNKTVDLRQYDADKLLQENLITEESYIDLMDGQRRFYEFPNPAAVGRFISHMKICSPKEPTLVLEENAAFHDSIGPQLEHAIELTENENASLVIFGPSHVFQGMSAWKSLHTPYTNDDRFEKLGSRGFQGTHGILYSPKGCRDLNHLFRGPKNMQIDGAISFHSQRSNLRNVWIEVNHLSIYPNSYLTKCGYCNPPAHDCSPSTIPYFIVIIVTAMFINIRRIKLRIHLIKIFSTLLLIFQNSALFIVMKSSVQDGKYLNSVVVLCVEFAKLFICTLYVMCDDTSMVVLRKKDFKSLAVPAVCYLVQQNLLLCAATALSASLLQTISQTKIVWTAFSAHFILKHKFVGSQKLAISLLFVGAIFLQYKIDVDVVYYVGIAFAIFAAFLSGFAGVWLEYVYKRDSISLWLKNIILASISIPLQSILLIKDHSAIHGKGFLQGFDNSVVLLIIIQSFGGILTGIVIKYTGNIVKNFATTISIIITILLSILLFENYVLNTYNIIGTTIIIIATLIYGSKPSGALLETTNIVSSRWFTKYSMFR